MSLIATVKVGKISNLSDARYCAGMGVQFLGFRVSPDDPAYIDPLRYQEMRGWFAGPQVVAEVTGDSLHGEFVEQFAPQCLEVALTSLEQWKTSGLPLLVRGLAEEILAATKQLESLQGQLSYIVLENDAGPVREVSRYFPTLLTIHQPADVAALLALGLKGFNLEGSSEDKPGLTDYGHLPDVLEALEEEP